MQVLYERRMFVLKKNYFIYEISSAFKFNAKAVYDATFLLCLIVNVIVIMGLI